MNFAAQRDALNILFAQFVFRGKMSVEIIPKIGNKFVKKMKSIEYGNGKGKTIYGGILGNHVVFFCLSEE